MLSPQLQNLIQLGIVEAQPVFKAPSFLDSSNSWRKLAVQGLFPDFNNLISPYAALDRLISTDTGCNTLNPGYINDSDCSKGSSLTIYEV
jgi:hypothetical protein